MSDHTQDQIDQLTARLEKMTEAFNCLSTRVERFLARQEAIGDPGCAPGCIRHDERLDEIEEMMTDMRNSLNVRLTDLEKTKIRFLGMKDGAGLVLVLIGGAIGTAASVFGQWMWERLMGRS